MTRGNFVHEIQVFQQVAKVIFRDASVRANVISELFRELAERDINALMIIQGASHGGHADIMAVIYESQKYRLEELRDDIIELIGSSDMVIDSSVALIKLSGTPDMERTPGIARRIFSTLADYRIKLNAFVAAGNTIAILIHENLVDLAEHALKQEFDLE